MCHESVIATTPDKRRSKMWMTKKLAITVLIALFSLLIVRHLVVNSPASWISRYQILHTNPLEWLNSPGDGHENTRVVVVAATAAANTSNSLDSRSSSPEGFQWLDTWNQLKQLANISNGLPHATEAINDARTCGLVVGSSITLIGTPGSLSGNFWIDLMGTALPGESEKPIVLHYNVRLTGDKTTQDPVIVQNAFTASNGWGFEDRCPCTCYCNAANRIGGDPYDS